jgi:4-hydroxy-4-methyl-2-oxoglutarate aldolase
VDRVTDLACRFRALSTADLVNAAAGCTWAGPTIRPLWRPVTVVGPAFTVQTPRGDNGPVHSAIADASPGDVVVVAAEADATVAIFGDVLARIGVARGLAGLITDGAVRDSDGIRQTGFAVFCAGVALAAPVKTLTGSYGTVVQIGAAQVAPGDWIVGDSDGVVVIPCGVAAEASTTAEGVREREASMVARAQAGEPTPRQLGLDER